MTGTIKHKVLGLMGMATLAVAACGSSTNNTTSSNGNGGGSPTPLPTESADPNAVDGGTLNMGVWQEPSGFLAAGITDSLTFSYLIDSPMVEGLLWYRSTDQTASAKTLADYYQPWLAKEVPTTDNGDVKTSGCKVAAAKMCVTWKLQDNVTWHDGSTFTSHDVCGTYKFFWLKYQDKNPTSLLSTSGWDQVIDCTEDAPNQATVSFKSVFGPYLSLGSGVYGVIPSKLLDAADAAGAATPDHKAANIEAFKFQADLTVGSKNPDAFKTPAGGQTLDLFTDGTGPYVFQSYQSGNSITLVPNKNYWNKAHHPHLAKVVFKIQADVSAQLNAAKAGDIDMGWDYRLGFLQALINEAANNKLKVQTTPDSGAEKIDMNLCDNAHGLCGPNAGKHPYTGDLVIRKAILMALNRQEIINNQAAGKTVIPHDAWQYLGVEYTLDPATNPITKYDPDAANAMLDQAGYTKDPACNGMRKWKDGTCITLSLGTTKGNKVRQDTEPLIQQYLAKVGINVKTPFQNDKAGVFFGSFKDGGDIYTHHFDMAMYTNTVSAPAEADSYYPGYHADCGGTNCPDASGKLQPELNNIPSEANKGNGQNDTGEDNATVDKYLDQGRNSVDLKVRATAYKKVAAELAKDLPELPLYQQVNVNSYSVKVQQFKPNDLVWDYNMYDWYCTGGNCQA